MAITGNLQTFYLSSVLQLLSNDKKTGILELTDGADIVQVYLRDGTIINAFGSSRVDRLTNYLQSEGIITEEQLQKCMRISAHTEKKIGMVMVEQGIISPEQLENLLHRQIEQTLYSLFLWDQGEFQYRDQNFDLSGQIITSFDTMQLVLEASRRVDEIAEIKKRVPNDHEVLEINPDTKTIQKAKLTTVERAVLSLVNGKRNVKKVIIDSGYDELKVYKTLFSLATSGLLLEEKKILKRPEETRDEVPELEQSAAKQSAEPIEQHATENDESIGLIFEAPDDAKSSPNNTEELDELVLEPEPDFDSETTMDAKGTDEPPAAVGTLESLITDVNPPAKKTVVKIDGQLIPEEESTDIEPVSTTQLDSFKKSEITSALKQVSPDVDHTEDAEEYAQKKQRVLKISALCVAAVIALVAAVLLLKPVLFPEKSQEKIVQVTAKKPTPVTKKKPKKTAAVVQHENKQVKPVAASAQAPSAIDFFQDQKGWISINLPQGFTASEQPSQDRTSVIIQYGDDIKLMLSIVPKSEDWNAEDAMYASIMKMKESGIREIQDYSTLKNAGCPGYVLHFINNQNHQSIQTALYRFVCFNKSVRMKVSSLNWRTPAGSELYRQICATFEESFFVYE